jgi:hypothetical protein
MIYQLKLVIEGAPSVAKLIEGLLGAPYGQSEAEIRVTNKFSSLKNCQITAQFMESGESRGLLLLVAGQWQNDEEGQSELLNTARNVFKVCSEMMQDSHEMLFFNTEKGLSKDDVADASGDFKFSDLWATRGSSPISGDNTDFSIRTIGLKHLGFNDIEIRQIPFGTHEFIDSFIGGLARWLLKEGYPRIGSLDNDPANGEVIRMQNHELRGTIKCRLIESGESGLYKVVSNIRGIGNINHQISEIVELPPPTSINLIRNMAQNNIDTMVENFSKENTKTIVRMELLYEEGKFEYMWAVLEKIEGEALVVRIIDSPIHRIDLSAEYPFNIKMEHIVDWATINEGEQASIIAGNYSERFTSE